MRPGLTRNLLWAVPLLVLAGAVAFGALAPAEWTDAWRTPVFDMLARAAGHPLDRPAFAGRIEDVFLALAGLALVLLCARGRVWWAAAALAAAILAAFGFAWFMAAANAMALDPLYPAAALTVVFLSGAAIPGMGGAGEKGKLRRSLEHHLAPQAAAAIVRAPEALNSAGEARTVTYLSCAIRRYPLLAEAFADEPEGLRRLTRRVLGALADTVLKYHGTIDRITPQGLAAYFNAPLEDPEHAAHACECALAMTRALESVNHALEQERRSDGTPYSPVEIGIGVHSGPAVIGDFGTDARPQFTVAGRAVELAQETGEAGAKYGPAIIVTDAVRKLAERNFAFLEVDTALTPNAPEPVKLYALLGNPLLRASPKFRALATFHDHIFQSYRAREWGKARALIEQCRALSGASPQLYDLYMSRIAWYEANPPGENWNGAVRAPVT